MEYDAQGFAEAEDGTRLFYGVRGDGPAIVLSDGIGCDGFAWKYLQPILARDHRVIHWHYRGHGRSGAPVDQARIDVPALARDLIRVLDHADTQDAVLFGHSMGTQVALEACMLAPDRTRGLVLLNGSYGKVTETFHGSDMLKNVLPSIIEAVDKHRGVARALWGRIPSGLAFQIARLSGEVDGLAIHEDDFRPYWDHINIMAPDLFFRMLRLAGEHSAEDMLPRIQAPALVMAAERDTFTPAAIAQYMATRIPNAEFVELRGASHAAPIEQPHAMLEHIQRFLRERTQAAPPVSAPPAQVST